MVCPICSGSSQRLFSKNDHWIRGCDTCRHRFADLRPTARHVEQVYSNAYFDDGGAGYPGYLRDSELLRDRGRRYARVLRRYTSPGLLLDVGSAAGFILRGFIDCGWRGVGLEPNQRMADYARTTLGLDVRTGALEEFGATGLRFDLVSMIQVVPHFYHLHSALEAAAKVTNPGGLWLVETWDRESLSARMFGRRWHEYEPPTVLHWFSPDGLETLVGKYGFQEIGRGRPRRWISGTHAKSILRHALAPTPRGRVLARMVELVPEQWRIPYPGNDLFWALYQKNGPSRGRGGSGER